MIVREEFKEVLCLLCGAIRDRNGYLGAAAVSWRDSHFPTTHHFKALLYVLQRGMGLAFIGGIKARAGIFHDDLCSGIRAPRPDGDAQRTGVGVNAMLDGILHDGLKGQRRQAELCKRRIVFHKKHLLISRLFHGQIGAGVLQLRGKGDEVLAGDGIEVLLQVAGEIHSDLSGLLRVLIAQAVDAHQGVVDEVGPHLQYHDIGALTGDFLLLLHILLDLI